MKLFVEYRILKIMCLAGFWCVCLGKDDFYQDRVQNDNNILIFAGN